MPRVTSRAARGQTQLDVAWRLDAGDYVTSLDVSRDGRACCASTGAGEVYVVDTTTGATRWRARAHAGGAFAIRFSPLGKTIASCGQDGTAKLWSLDAGDLLAELPGGSAWVEHVGWAPSGQNLATASGSRVRIWTASGEPVLETEPLVSTVTAIAWGRASTEIAAACYGGVHICPISARGKARHLRWSGSLISMAWSPDGKVIACASQDRSVHFWRLPSGNDSEMSGFRFKPQALGWNQQSTLLATAGDSAVTVWDFAGKGPEGSRPIELEGHLGLCTQLTFSPRRSILASGSADMSVLLWEPRRSGAATHFAFLEDQVSALAWHPREEALLAADAGGAVVSFHLPEGSRTEALA